MKKNKVIALAIGIVVTVVVVAGGWVVVHRSSNTQKAATRPAPIVKVAPPTPPAPVVFDKAQFSVDDPTSKWVVVNKKRPFVPANYAPADLRAPSVALRLKSINPEMHVRAETASAVQKMFVAAKLDDISLMVASAYRSYDLQVNVYNAEVKRYGQAGADAESARPGHSEHQTGLVADIEPTTRKCEVQVCFGNTPEGAWVAANSYKYGFIVRYQLNQQAITGYNYEPWHLRFVGRELAEEMQNTGITTLEEFFGLPPAADY